LLGTYCRAKREHGFRTEQSLPMPEAKHNRLRITKLMVFAGCLAISWMSTATTAAAHVKWFVNCNASDEPLPVRDVFTARFFFCATLFLAVFYVACEAEESAVGVAVSRLLDRWTAPLHRRTEDLLRAAAAISFALLWADGSLILTPELKGSNFWLLAIQLLIPAYLFTRATLPAAGAGIFVLYGYGVATYGLFHMLDYWVFLGLGGYFALSVSNNRRILAFRFDLLRWTVALSLLWPAMEKFVYPAWVAPIAITHPEVTFGFDVALVVTAAGIVEFGLSFALFWTPLVRRLAALAFAVLLTAATFDFGKVDGIGHMMVIIILLLVFADPGRKQASCSPPLAPVASCAAWAATIFLYTGAHTLYYRSWSEALAPLVGAALSLAFILVRLRWASEVFLPTTARRPRPAVGDPKDGWGHRGPARALSPRDKYVDHGMPFPSSHHDGRHHLVR